MKDLYENYLTDHAGEESESTTALVLSRDLLPWMPGVDSRCLDLGCGQGGLVHFLRSKGYSRAYGVDISPEQVERAHNLNRQYVLQGDASDFLVPDSDPWDVITAFDFLEHLDAAASLRTIVNARDALGPNGLFVARLPNAAGPLYGAIQYGDFTHQSVYTARAVRQLANAAGFSRVEFREVPPPVSGLRSLGRRVTWSAIGGLFRTAYAAESGQIRGHLVTSNFMAYLFR